MHRICDQIRDMKTILTIPPQIPKSYGSLMRSGKKYCLMTFMLWQESRILSVRLPGSIGIVIPRDVITVQFVEMHSLSLMLNLPAVVVGRVFTNLLEKTVSSIKRIIPLGCNELRCFADVVILILVISSTTAHHQPISDFA